MILLKNKDSQDQHYFGTKFTPIKTDNKSIIYMYNEHRKSIFRVLGLKRTHKKSGQKTNL